MEKVPLSLVRPAFSHPQAGRCGGVSGKSSLALVPAVISIPLLLRLPLDQRRLGRLSQLHSPASSQGSLKPVTEIGSVVRHVCLPSSKSPWGGPINHICSLSFSLAGSEDSRQVRGASVCR